MKNNILSKLPIITKYNQDYINFTRTDDIITIPSKYFNEEYWVYREIPIDIRIEVISYNFYGTVDYWDIILAFNGIKSIYDLPKNNDLVYKLAKEEFDNWFDENFVIHRVTPQQRRIFEEWYNSDIRFIQPSNFPYLEDRLKKFEEFYFEENEKNKIIKLIKPIYIPELLKEIR